MNFETALKNQLEATPDLRRRGKRILEVIDSPPSKRRTRILERMEGHAKVTAGLPNAVNIDWATFDWSKWLDAILKVLLALLPLLLV